ncbi:hypothetical protein HYQ45_010189 [Verticillium longisporum]|uniref:Uncharacterized protein n=1 Tax=Verticillium longisporum TaxID=100787 RepID=A0A8I3AMF0_VERLO|nr:hypothetical protein HYQ45_010189 [Verticillium longisporum]
MKSRIRLFFENRSCVSRLSSILPRVRDVVLLSVVDHMARTTGNGAARPGTGDLPVPSGNSPPTRVLPLGGGTLRKVMGRALRDACSSPAMADGRCWQS